MVVDLFAVNSARGVEAPIAQFEGEVVEVHVSPLFRSIALNLGNFIGIFQLPIEVFDGFVHGHGLFILFPFLGK